MCTREQDYARIHSRINIDFKAEVAEYARFLLLIDYLAVLKF